MTCHGPIFWYVPPQAPGTSFCSVGKSKETGDGGVGDGSVRPRLRDTALGTGDLLFEQPSGLRSPERPRGARALAATWCPGLTGRLRVQGQSGTQRVVGWSTETPRCQRAPRGTRMLPFPAVLAPNKPGKRPARPPWVLSDKSPGVPSQRQGDGRWAPGPSQRAGTYEVAPYQKGE